MSEWSELLVNEDEYLYDGQVAVNREIYGGLYNGKEFGSESESETLSRTLQICIRKSDHLRVLCTVTAAAGLGLANEVVNGIGESEDTVRAMIEKAQAGRRAIAEDAQNLLNEQWGGWDICETGEKESKYLTVNLAKLCRLGVPKATAKTKLIEQKSKRKDANALRPGKGPHFHKSDVISAIDHLKHGFATEAPHLEMSPSKKRKLGEITDDDGSKVDPISKHSRDGNVPKTPPSARKKDMSLMACSNGPASPSGSLACRRDDPEDRTVSSTPTATETIFSPNVSISPTEKQRPVPGFSSPLDDSALKAFKHGGKVSAMIMNAVLHTSLCTRPDVFLVDSSELAKFNPSSPWNMSPRPETRSSVVAPKAGRRASAKASRKIVIPFHHPHMDPDLEHWILFVAFNETSYYRVYHCDSLRREPDKNTVCTVKSYLVWLLKLSHDFVVEIVDKVIIPSLRALVPLLRLVLGLCHSK